MEQKTLNNYQRWLNSDHVSEEDKKILRSYSDEEIDDAFYQDIQFGTAGMRGILGPGTNRMNEFTVKKACIAYGKFLVSKYIDAGTRGVAISHDNRHKSREFTLLCADILNKMGLNVYIFDSLRPTPELSYAIRYKGCCGGIMITASHNPKEHNGFKVYDSYGCQLTPYKIVPLLDIIATMPDELSCEPIEVTIKGVTNILGEEIDNSYVAYCQTVQLNPSLDKNNFKIVYTPNNGASYVNAMRVFKECRYDVYPVLECCAPDPDFSNLKSPNPEDPVAYELPIKLAKEIDADLVTMTDPDGDRVGLACKNRKGDYILLTGNESAALLMDYILNERKKKGFLSVNGVVYNTIVTSSLGSKIAANYGVKTESFLTGFKYIGDRIQYYEEHGGPEFEFGYEESYGCLIKPFVRDKDGIQAILLYCEMALYYKQHDITLDEAYHELGVKYGFHKTKLFNIAFKGSNGAKKLKILMDTLINKPFTKFLDNEVVYVDDYYNLLRKNVKTGFVSTINGIPMSSLIKFTFKDGTNIAVRPSGTEPKCKFYIEVVNSDEELANKMPDKYYEELMKYLNL